MKVAFDHKKLKKTAVAFGLRFVILHGSLATARFRKDSDIDIAVLGYKNLASKRFLKLYQIFEKLFCLDGHELDLKTLYRVDPLFRYEVTHDGQLLCGDSLDYEEYKSFAYRDYMDSQSLFDLEKNMVKKPGRNRRSVSLPGQVNQEPGEDHDECGAVEKRYCGNQNE